MKQIYTTVSRTLIMAAGVLLFHQANAQNSTTTGQGDCSVVVQNFNTNSGGHASPSIYGGMFDSTLFYNHTLGYWTEMDGGRTTGPLSPRVVSIISPPYTNPNPPTIFDVGFWYQVPNATIDRFQVRLIQISPGPGGTTVSNIVASSGVQNFAQWSTTMATKTDLANPANSGDTGRICIRLMDQDIVNGPATFYRVEIAYVLNTPGTDNFFAAYDNLSIGPVILPSPLPVNFMGIVANKSDNGVLVRWDVADETDVREYQLERSTNGSSFTTAGTVAARQKNVYSFTDAAVKAPVVYYRVKSVDIDGRTKYSGIIRIVNGSSYANELTVYPSPAHDQLTLAHSQLGSHAKLVISTMDGRVLKVVRPSRGASNTMLDISSFSSGMYILRLENGNGQTEITTFVKQ